MILGRSTVIWMGLITVLLQFLSSAVPIFMPDVDKASVNTLFDGLTGVMAAAIALIAGTSTTPVNDPRLPIGTIVNGTTDAAPTGVVVAENDPRLTQKNMQVKVG